MLCVVFGRVNEGKSWRPCSQDTRHSKNSLTWTPSTGSGGGLSILLSDLCFVGGADAFNFYCFNYLVLGEG